MKNLINNTFSQEILEKAQRTKARIILPENDKRVKDAKSFLVKNKINVIDIDYDKINKYLDFISKLKFTKNWTTPMMLEFLDDPIHLSCAMLACNDADGVVAGATVSTAEIIRTAIRLVGIDNSAKWVSSMFLMVSSDYKCKYSFADCAVIPEPDSDQLVSIAYNASKLHKILTGEESKIAFLSFSTIGSSSHYRVEKVKNAYMKFKAKYPKILCEGEIQFDAAWVPDIARDKIPDTIIEGKANVFIFPNLDAGNIGYKIAQRMGNYYAWGPLLQGLKKPVNDLSRGCSIDDIINIASITSLQSNCYANV